MQFKSIFRLLILSSVLLYQCFLSAQENTNNQVEKYYITKDGIKTPIVNEPFSPDNEKLKFLYDRASELDKTSRYDKLKEAIQETEKISTLIDTVQSRSTNSDGTFSLSGAKRNIDLLNEERGLKNKTSASSLEEQIFLKNKYGDRPTFFINEIEVSQELYNKVLEKEILNKQVVVQNTISGNPNGEIRIDVPQKTLERLGIKDDRNATYSDSYAFNNEEKVDNKKTASKVVEQEDPSLSELLDRIKEVERNNNQYTQPKQSTSSDTPKPQNQPVYTKKQEPKKQEIVYSFDEINNKAHPKSEKQVSKEDDVFVVRSSDWKKVELKEDKEESAVKRSVRDIKEREREK